MRMESDLSNGMSLNILQCTPATCLALATGLSPAAVELNLEAGRSYMDRYGPKVAFDWLISGARRFGYEERQQVSIKVLRFPARTAKRLHPGTRRHHQALRVRNSPRSRPTSVRTSMPATTTVASANNASASVSAMAPEIVSA